MARYIGRHGTGRAAKAVLLSAIPPLMLTTEAKVFGEWSVERTTVTGRPFTQTYAGRLVAENGKIKLLRESLELVRAARAMLPNGVPDIPA